MREPGLCEHCGRQGDMYSFDTTECFTFLHIPLVPLGKRRVMNECPSCGHHLIKKYEKTGDFLATARIISLCLFVLVLVFASSYRFSKHRQVFLINGLNRPYQIEINGTELSLPVDIPVRTKLPEGKTTILMKERGLDSGPLHIEIKSSFLERLLNNKTYVINPDGVGVLLWEKVPYMTDYMIRTTKDSKYEYKLCAGRYFYEFKNLDYEFEKFPDEVTMKGDITYRTGVSQLTEYSPASVLDYLVENEERASAVSFIRNHLSFNPTDPSYLNYLAVLSPLNECLKFLQTRLHHRPVLVEWHRLYQHLIEQEKPEYDLFAEYQAYLDQEPDNSDLQYLVGRLIQNPKEAVAYYRQACADGRENAYIYYSLANYALSGGEFTTAYDYINKAIAMEPGINTFVRTKDQVLLALGNYDALLAKNALERKNNPYDGQLVAEAIRLTLHSEKELSRTGRRLQADRLRNDYVVSLLQEKVETVDTWDDYLQAVYYYCLGDLENYQSHLAKVDPEGYGFSLTLSAGDVEKAAAALTHSPDPAYTDYLLLYLLAESSGWQQQAAVSLEEAIKLMRYNNDLRYLAACLEGTCQPDPDRIRQMCLDITEKKIALTAFGVKFPEYRKAFLQLARTLNYEKKVPYHFLRSIQEKYGDL